MRRACDNPFAVHRVLRERYRLDAAGWLVLMRRLEALGWRGAIVGPHGSGKTTLLEDLGARLAQKGHGVHVIRLDRSTRRVPRWAFPDRSIVLCDGAEQLGFSDWLRLRARARRLVITTHRSGRLPLLHQCSTSPALLRSLVASLGQEMPAHAAESLHRRCGGNVRVALCELYDEWARLPDQESAVAMSAGP